MTKKEVACLARRLWSFNFDYVWYRMSGRRVLSDRAEDRCDMLREYATEIGLELWTEFARLPDGLVYPVAVVCRSRYGVWVQMVRGYRSDRDNPHGLTPEQITEAERIYVSEAERLVKAYPNCCNIPSV